MSTIIVFAEDWQSHPSSSQHIMRELSQYHRVVWVNSIGLRSPGFNGRDWRRLWQKGTALCRRRPAVERETSRSSLAAVVAPWCLPFHQFAAVRWLNRQLLRWQLSRVLKTLGLESEPLVLWLALPSAVCIVGALQEQQVIYYCGDDFSALAGVDHVTMQRLEAQLVERADLVWCASNALLHKFQHPHCQLLTHGVDAALFAQQWPRPTVLPTDKPIVGFYGMLAAWFDVSLVVELARRCPEWHFVLIGHSQIDLSALTQLANVQWLPAMPHQQLVQYASHCQALMLPFVQCQQIEFCNPLKLKEYLAIGKPILSVPFPALTPFQSCVFTSTDVAQWQATLLEIATWDASALQQWQTACRALIQSESWGHKAAQVQASLLQQEAARSDSMSSDQLMGESR